MGRNNAERLVFSHLYDSLYEIPCYWMATRGGARPGLATLDRAGDSVARLTLREDVLFWDGTTATASDVVESLWNGDYADNGIDSVVIEDDRSVKVYATSADFQPEALASSRFAMIKPSGTPWPMGTGPYLVASSSDIETILIPAFDSSRAVMRFVDCRNADLRDLIDDSLVDVMLVEDAAIALYAARQPRLSTPTLPTGKAYVILAPSRVAAQSTGAQLPVLTDSLRNDFAFKAVRFANADAIRDGLWPNMYLPPCDLTTSTMPTTPIGKREIVFETDDPVSRELAERLVSLASSTSVQAANLTRTIPGLSDRQAGVTTLGLPSHEFASRLSRGADFAYIVVVPSNVPDRCRASKELIQRAPWVAAPGVVLSDAWLPLVTTRMTAIILNRHFGTSGSGIELSCDYYGGVRITGWKAAENR